MRYAFDEVKLSDTVKTYCRHCSKKLTRKISDYQTINLFNKNSEGLVKTYEEICVEVAASLDKQKAKMQSEGVICKACNENKVAS